MTLARGWIKAAPPAGLGEATARHILVLTDGVGPARGGARLAAELQELATAGIEVLATTTDHVEPSALAAFGAGQVVAGGSLEDRRDIIDRAVARRDRARRRHPLHLGGARARA